MTRWCCLIVWTLATVASALDAHGQEPIRADVLLKGGTIIDGTGAPGRVGDVAIRDDRIVAVGEFPLEAASQIIDCRGLIVVPGFIDLHNHSDRQIVSRKTRANVNYLMQGCTTIVTGNCGSGPIDVGEYYGKIDAAGAGTNVAHLLPQGSLRDAVLGTAHRAAEAAELEQMKNLADKAMQEGAWGMSTGLIYVPSSYADTAELVEIARVVGSYGGVYASHIRNESTGLLAAVDEALRIGREAGLPVHISHFKSSGPDAWGLVRRAAEVIQEARAAGQIVTADQYPYIASSTSLDATIIPPAARAGGREALVARLDDPEQGPPIRTAMEANLKKRNGGEAIVIARYSRRQDWVGKSLAEIAAKEQKSPLDVALEIVRNGGASIVNFSMSEDDVRHIMQIPWVATASDGRAYLPGADRPHPRNYGTFPRKIGYYALQEMVLPVEQAVRSSSGLPADILGLKDRGYVKTSYFADVVVFDPEEFRDRATFPAPHQYSAGVRYVFVNGSPAVVDGYPTGALSGRALRHEPSK